MLAVFRATAQQRILPECTYYNSSMPTDAYQQR